MQEQQLSYAKFLIPAYLTSWTKPVQNRSLILQTIIDIVLEEKAHGVLWDDLILDIAPLVNQQEATHYRLQRLKKTPSETPSETIWRGQKALARKYIDAAHRYGRITYFETLGGKRWVYPGDPPTTGGRYAKPTSWPLPNTGLDPTNP